MGQVISGQRLREDGTPMGGQQFQYAFDEIGNRLSTGGRPSAVGTYQNNFDNQISARSVAGVIDVIGIANPTTNVTVNGQTAIRQGEYFYAPLPVNNSTAQYPLVTISSPYSPGASTSGYSYVPPANEQFVYDADGNLTQDGRWNYGWDAENRLVTMTNRISGGVQQLAFEYDVQGRRIGKTISGTTTIKYLYDGWNLLAELDGASSSVLRTYAWGLDLSGSIQGAGGVGGLLWVNNQQTTGGLPTGIQWVAYEAIGNVAALVALADGSVSARYEYGPFGEVIRATGPLAKANPFRFSSKYGDNESALLYYGYRYYSASTGRWLSRDPLGDVAFLMEQSKGKTRQIQQQLANQSNLPGYIFVQNDPEDRSDYLGLILTSLDASVEACMRLPTPAAQQACLTDLFDTLGLPKKCCALAAAVQIAKRAVGAVGGCKSGDSCATLSAKSATWLSLALARTRLNTKCFSGGDPGHQQALADAWANIGNCVAIQIKNGCAGPY